MPMTMAKRERIEPKEAGGWLLVGLAALVGFTLYERYLARPGLKAWNRCALLYEPAWWRAIMTNNDVNIPSAHIDWVYRNGPRVRLSVQRFHDARGLLIDQDAVAAGAIEALPNPLAIAYFVYLFADEYGATPGTWGREFLSDAAMGAAAAHLTRIGAITPYGQQMNL
jgi:hypothetical protein